MEKWLSCDTAMPHNSPLSPQSSGAVVYRLSLSLRLSKTFEFAEGRDLVTVYEFIRPPYIDNIAQTTNLKKKENAGR